MRDFIAASVQSPPGGVVTPAYLDQALASAAPVDLVVLPELSNVPYFPLEPGSLDSGDPATLDGPLVTALGETARRHVCHIMAGLFLGQGGGASTWNSAVLLGPTGELLEGRTLRGRTAQRFDKVHLCDVQIPPSVSFCESSYFEPGDDFVVWDTDLGCLGVLICYDRHFPEAWASVRALGAEVVCVCTTSPSQTEATFVAEIQAMALQFSVFVVMANRVGRERLRTSGTETEFLGSSCIVDAHGRVLAAAPPRQPTACVAAELDATMLDAARLQNQFWEHRRPELYATSAPAGSNRWS
jgi:N-carbamoylputrescine amidase